MTEVDGETVLMDCETDRILALHGVAPTVWSLLETPSTSETLQARLLERFDVDVSTCRNETEALLAELENFGAIRRAAGAEEGAVG
jgi:arsenate reductase-like glutaredoxin family protein